MVLVLLSVTGCTGGGDELPSPTDFRSGGCSRLAPDVLTIAGEAGRLGTTSTPPQEVRDSLAAAQSRVREAQPTLEPDLTAATSSLVEAVGVVRLRSDTRSYEAALGSELRTSADQLIGICTADS